MRRFGRRLKVGMGPPATELLVMMRCEASSTTSRKKSPTTKGKSKSGKIVARAKSPASKKKAAAPPVQEPSPVVNPAVDALRSAAVGVPRIQKRPADASMPTDRILRGEKATHGAFRREPSRANLSEMSGPLAENTPEAMLWALKQRHARLTEFGAGRDLYEDLAKAPNQLPLDDRTDVSPDDRPNVPHVVNRESAAAAMTDVLRGMRGGEAGFRSARALARSVSDEINLLDEGREPAAPPRQLAGSSAVEGSEDHRHPEAIGEGHSTSDGSHGGASNGTKEGTTSEVTEIVDRIPRPMEGVVPRSTVFNSDLDKLESEYRLAVDAERAKAPVQPLGVTTIATSQSKVDDRTSLATAKFREALHREWKARDTPKDSLDLRNPKLFAPLAERLQLADEMNEARRESVAGPTNGVGGNVNDYRQACTPSAAAIRKSDFDTEEEFQAARRTSIMKDVNEAMEQGYDLEDPQWQPGHAQFVNVPTEFYPSRFFKERPRKGKRLSMEMTQRLNERRADAAIEEASASSAGHMTRAELHMPPGAIGAPPTDDVDNGSIARSHFGDDSGSSDTAATADPFTKATASVVDAMSRGQLDDMTEQRATFRIGAHWRAETLTRLDRDQRRPENSAARRSADDISGEYIGALALKSGASVIPSIADDVEGKATLLPQTNMYVPRYVDPSAWKSLNGNTMGEKKVVASSAFGQPGADRAGIEANREALQKIDEKETALQLNDEGPMDVVRLNATSFELRKKRLIYLKEFPNNHSIQHELCRIVAIAGPDGNRISLPRDADEPFMATRDARRLAADMGMDLIQVKAIASRSKMVAPDVAMCVIDDVDRHAREFITLGERITPQPPKPLHEVPFRGTIAPFHLKYKATEIAKYLAKGMPVVISLTEFGTPREGYDVLDLILSQIKDQSLNFKAWHTAGNVKATSRELRIALKPSTDRNPKHEVIHPTHNELMAARDNRLVERERELHWDNLSLFTTHKDRLRYLHQVANGSAWRLEGDGMSMTKLRRLKKMLGFLPKGNKELYAKRGDVNMPAPFHTGHQTTIDKIDYPRESNLDQAERGVGVIAKRAKMSISEMADRGETESNPSTLGRHFYRMQGDVFEVQKMKESLGLDRKFKKTPAFDAGFATLGVGEDNGMGDLANRSKSSQ